MMRSSPGTHQPHVTPNLTRLNWPRAAELRRAAREFGPSSGESMIFVGRLTTRRNFLCVLAIRNRMMASYDISQRYDAAVIACCVVLRASLRWAQMHGTSHG